MLTRVSGRGNPKYYMNSPSIAARPSLIPRPLICGCGTHSSTWTTPSLVRASASIRETGRAEGTETGWSRGSPRPPPSLHPLSCGKKIFKPGKKSRKPRISSLYMRNLDDASRASNAPNQILWITVFCLFLFPVKKSCTYSIKEHHYQ